MRGDKSGKREIKERERERVRIGERNVDEDRNKHTMWVEEESEKKLKWMSIEERTEWEMKRDKS